MRVLLARRAVRLARSDGPSRPEGLSLWHQSDLLHTRVLHITGAEDTLHN